MVYYFGYYKSAYIEDFFPSGSINAISFKMNYIIKKIKESGYDVEVVSSYISEKNGMRGFRRVIVDEHQIDNYLPTLRVRGALARITGLFRTLSVIIGMLLIIKKHSKIIIYHNPQFAKIISYVKRIKHLKVILEVEEILYENTALLRYAKQKENEKILFELADSYIVVNDLIYEKYLVQGKKHIVVYGAYDNAKITTIEKDNSIIRILFSGSIDRVRGAFTAIRVAKFLNERYEIHICGSGSTDTMEEFRTELEKETNFHGGCRIVFHGQLSESELSKLAFSCDIGMNLQDTSNPFEAVSFPSKITFYFLHGLNVVSTKMSSVLNSKLSQYIAYAESTPESVAKAIQSMKLFGNEEIRNYIDHLDNEFIEGLKWILE